MRGDKYKVNKDKAVSVRLDPIIRKRIETVATKLDLDRTMLIRLSITAMLSHVEKGIWKVKKLKTD